MNPGERRYRRRGGEKEKGFTLIELMVSLVVMTLGLLTVIHLQVVTVRGHAYSRERTQATQIALGVAEEMRNRSRAWVSQRIGPPVAFNAVFPDIILAATPGTGEQLSSANMNSLLRYANKEIAVDNAFPSAYRINTFGYSPDSGAATPDLYAGALYRVHYVAHFFQLPPPAPPGLQNTVRVTVFVSWDNKDHGQGTNWKIWAGVNNYWRRHMVALTFYLNRTKTY